MKKGIGIGIILTLACIVPEHGQAATTLGDRYGASPDGVVVAAPINDLASRLVGHTITVYCYPVPSEANDDGTLGWTQSVTSYSEDGTFTVEWLPEIHLRGDLCGALDKLIHADDYKRWFHGMDNKTLAGVALTTIIHEAEHLILKSDDEGLVECTAMKNTWPVLKSFHLSQINNVDIYEAAWFMHDNAMPAQYLTVC